MVTSSKRADTTGCVTQGSAPEPLPLHQDAAVLHLHRRPKHSSGSVSMESLGPGAHKVWLSTLNVSGRYGV